MSLKPTQLSFYNFLLLKNYVLSFLCFKVQAHQFVYFFLCVFVCLFVFICFMAEFIQIICSAGLFCI